LNKTLLVETIAALPGEHVCVGESLEERIVLHFGPSVEAATWRAGLRERWQHRLREIFSDAAENQFGPLSNVVLLATGQSQRAPLGYVPRPLVSDFSRGLLHGLTQRKAIALLQPGADKARIEEAVEQTRDWLEKNLPGSGYGNARKRVTPEEALATHPATRLADGVCLGLWGVEPAVTPDSERTCIYCGGAAESIETPEMAEGDGVKKFSKRWIATGSRSFANLCAR